MRLLIVLMLIPIVCSCAQRRCTSGFLSHVEVRYTPEIFPPVATTQFSSRVPGYPDINGRPLFLTEKGQAVVVGDLALTAAHVLPNFIGITSDRPLSISGVESEYALVNAGLDDGVTMYPVIPQADSDFSGENLVEHLPKQTYISWKMIPHDWAMVRLEKPVTITGSPIGIDTGPIKPNACLSLIRSTNDGKTLEILDTHAVLAISDDPDYPVPQNLVFLARPSEFVSPGWSGCFVGRRSADGRWLLVGVLAGDADPKIWPEIETGYLIVVRPPKEVLEQFVAAGRGPATPPPSSAESQ